MNQSINMDQIVKWASFYRANPQRFAKDYLNIELKVFQKILLWAMMHNLYFCFIACRGLGKSYLTAVYCVIRCILYPGTRIAISSGTKNQAINVLKKITEDLMMKNGWGSTLLKNEIEEWKVGVNDPSIKFKNSSIIFVATANDNSRSYRANVLVCDEFRMIKWTIIDQVLKNFLTEPRTPAFMNKKKYKDDDKYLEPNIQIYMSSAWYVNHWSFDHMRDYAASMLMDESEYFCCALPYQLSIKEKLILKTKVLSDMTSSQFNPITFGMEMECIWYGDDGGSFFKYDDLSRCRKLNNSLPSPVLISKKKEKVPHLAAKERRVMSVDIALMASKNKDNDATSIQINSALLDSNSKYISNILLIESFEGIVASQLALKILKFYYTYNCTDLVIDASGAGQPIVDLIMEDIVDPETGEVYSGLDCCNNQEVSERCHIKNAKKAIWAIKATAAFNNECCILLKSGFETNRINLLINDYEMEDELDKKNENFYELPLDIQKEYQRHHIETSLLINEMINLEYEVNGNNLKLKEKSGMRKDRYSSLAYNYWVVNQIERKQKPIKGDFNSVIMATRKPKYNW